MKKRVLILEPDRTLAKCILNELKNHQITVDIAYNANQAIELADIHKPDLVISELSLAGHSGSEFLYEFRTYTDWLDVPILVYSTIKVEDRIKKSRDWQNLKISEILYKPDETLQSLAETIEELV